MRVDPEVIFAESRRPDRPPVWLVRYFVTKLNISAQRSLGAIGLKGALLKIALLTPNLREGTIIFGAGSKI